MGDQEPDCRGAAKLEPECVGVEPCGGSELWTAYDRRVQQLSWRLYDQWNGGEQEYIVLHHCACEQVCVAGVGAGGVEYCGESAECRFPATGWEKGIDRIE